MPSINISAAKPGSLTRKLPESLSFDKSFDAVTVLDVKKALAAKNPKASLPFDPHNLPRKLK